MHTFIQRIQTQRLTSSGDVTNGSGSLRSCLYKADFGKAHVLYLSEARGAPVDARLHSDKFLQSDLPSVVLCHIRYRLMLTD